MANRDRAVWTPDPSPRTQHSTPGTGSIVNRIGRSRAPNTCVVRYELRRTSLSLRYTNRPTRTAGGGVMEPNIWPLDPMSAAALVTRIIEDIDASTDGERDDLLADLLCAAWGSIWAQNQ